MLHFNPVVSHVYCPRATIAISPQRGGHINYMLLNEITDIEETGTKTDPVALLIRSRYKSPLSAKRTVELGLSVRLLGVQRGKEIAFRVAESRERGDGSRGLVRAHYRGKAARARSHTFARLQIKARSCARYLRRII